MTAVRTDLHENALAGLIDRGVPVIVLAPHLGDAALSCGALLTYAVSRTPVTVVTFFTEPGHPPYTMSARRYLRQAGVPALLPPGERGGHPSSPFSSHAT